MNFHVMANLNVTVSEKPVNNQSYGIVTVYNDIIQEK